MATQGPSFSLSIEDLALNLLLERETTPRARLIIDHLTQLFPAGACVLYLLRESEPQQWLTLSSGGELSGVDALIPVNAGTLGRLATNGVPTIYSGTELQREDYAHLTVRRTMRSLATVPILSSGAIIGAIEVVTFDQSLDQDSLAVIKQVAEYAAPALTSAAQNDQQTNAQLSSITRLTTLYDLERVFHSTLQMDDLFPIITSKIRELVEVQAVNLWMVDGDKLILISSDGTDGSVKIGDVIAAAPGTIPGDVSETGEGICIEDANDQQLRARNAAAAGTEIFSLIAAPVMQQGALVGVLEAINPDDGVSFDEDDLFLLSTISESAAGALYNASLLEAERKVEILQTLVSVSQEITSTLSMDRVLTAIVNGPSTVIPYERASIALEQHGRLKLQAMSGVTELKPGNPDAARLNELLQWVALLHQELRISQIDDEIDSPREETRAKFKQYFGETGMRGFYSLSLTDDQGRVGVLTFESSNPDFLSTAHLEMIKILGSQATLAVRNAQMYTEVPFIGVLEPILQKKKKFMAMEKGRRSALMVLVALAVAFLAMFPLPMRVDGGASVEPVHSAMVQPEVEGVVKTVNVREGDHVQKGTVLASLQDWDYRSALAASEAKYGMAIASMNRALAVNDTTEAGVQRQQADYWRAEVDRARQRLDMTQLRSPIEGYVATPQIENLVGRHLSPGDSFAEIVDTSHTTVDVAVEEKDVALLQRGDKAAVKLDGYPSRTFRGLASGGICDLSQDRHVGLEQAVGLVGMNRERSMRGKVYWVLIVTGTLLLASVCGCDRATAPPASASASKPAESTPVPPRTAASAEDVVASGPIVVENQVDVSAEREGVITQIIAEAGTAVKKGQLLARMDDRQLIADHEAAEARVRSVSYDEKNWEARVKLDQVDLDRSEKMMQSDLITKEMLDHARFKLEASKNELERERQDLLNAKAMLQSLDLELEKTQVQAPFSGVVGRRYVRAGQKVALGDRLFWVTATAPLRVKFTLPEAYLGRLKRGDPVTVTPGIAPEQRYTAKIVELSPVIDPSSGTFELTAEITGKTGELRPGMSANIRIPQ